MTAVSERRVVRNRLLATVGSDELDEILSRATFVKLEVRNTLFDPDKPIESVYFMESGVASVVGVMSDGTAVETATIGYEGFVGLSIFHGVDRTASQAFCQVPGSAYRLSVADFRGLLDQPDGSLKKILGRYTEALFTMVAQTSACNRMHTMRQRCARWLLQTHDRVGEGTFDLTQSFLAQMLGVRRASVTDVALGFQALGIIDYKMGRMEILDREALEGSSCECYSIIAREFDRLIDGKREPFPFGVELSRNGQSLTEPPSFDPTTDS